MTLPEPAKRKNCFIAISNAMVSYLEQYPAPYSYKQKIRKDFYRWLMDIRSVLRISDKDEKVPDELANHLEEDTAVALVKELHNRSGLTKKDLAERLGIGVRAVQKDLRKLDPTLYEGSDISGNESYVPFRLGGQPVQIKITGIFENGSKECRYITTNSLHPIILQENLMQAGTIMRALFRQAAYTDDLEGGGSEVSRLIAADVWFQLSDYAKKKIRRYFDMEIDGYKLSEFLDEIEDSIPNNCSAGFISEKDMISNDRFPRMAPDETMVMACKARRPCNLKLDLDGQRLELKHQIIHRLHKDDLYAAESDDGHTVTFSYDDVLGIELI